MTRSGSGDWEGDGNGNLTRLVSWENHQKSSLETNKLSLPGTLPPFPPRPTTHDLVPSLYIDPDVILGGLTGGRGEDVDGWGKVDNNSARGMIWLGLLGLKKGFMILIMGSKIVRICPRSAFQ